RQEQKLRPGTVGIEELDRFCVIATAELDRGGQSGLPVAVRIPRQLQQPRAILIGKHFWKQQHREDGPFAVIWVRHSSGLLAITFGGSLAVIVHVSGDAEYQCRIAGGPPFRTRPSTGDVIRGGWVGLPHILRRLLPLALCGEMAPPEVVKRSALFWRGK